MHKLYRSAAAVLCSFLLFGTVPAASAETIRTNDSPYTKKLNGSYGRNCCSA